MATKTTGGLEDTAYSYNVRSWPVRAQGSLFTEVMAYNEAQDGLSPAHGPSWEWRWDGRMAAMGWRAPGDGGLREYAFSYDGMGRLTDADYDDLITASPFFYTEHFTYDDTGCITDLTRYGLCDDGAYDRVNALTLEYSGYRLSYAEDAVQAPTANGADAYPDTDTGLPEYGYDENGNMTKDLNRNISSIEYNSLNLPSHITVSGDGEVTQIENTYDSMGNKLRTTYTREKITGPISYGLRGGAAEPQGGGISGGIPGGLPNPMHDFSLPVTDYRGNAVYRKGTLSMLLTGEGYVTFTNDTTPVYHYYLRDHLGSVRVVFRQDGAVEQVNHYYASGALMWDISTGGTVQPYKFGGKEMERTAGLDWCDFSARWLDTALGPRFTTMDPLCEKYYDVSPYAYCGGDPVNKIDPDGMDDWEINSSGQIVKRIRTKEHDSFYIVDQKGNRVSGKSISFEYGFVKSATSQATENGISYDVYETRGDNNSTKLFEFLAENTGVEWSQLKLGEKGKKGLNVLTTSHIKDKEYGSVDMINKQYQHGYTLRADIHSHPGNHPYPSGLNGNKSGDIYYSKWASSVFPNLTISFQIYIPKEKKYIQYSPFSEKTDFFNLNLPEVIVKGKSNKP